MKYNKRVIKREIKNDTQRTVSLPLSERRVLLKLPCGVTIGAPVPVSKCLKKFSVSPRIKSGCVVKIKT